MRRRDPGGERRIELTTPVVRVRQPTTPLLMPPRTPKRLDRRLAVREQAFGPLQEVLRPGLHGGGQPEGLHAAVVEAHGEDRLRGVQGLREDGSREGEAADVFEHVGDGGFGSWGSVWGGSFVGRVGRSRTGRGVMGQLCLLTGGSEREQGGNALQREDLASAVAWVGKMLAESGIVGRFVVLRRVCRKRLLSIVIR